VEFWEKHLWDSLRGIAPFLQEKDQDKTLSAFKVIDIGTGAGFPGIPIAIALPDWTITLLDSTRKKITFLNTLLTQLSIQNANTITGRSEIASKQLQHQQSYDLALIRAVGSADVCAEYALPYLKQGGLAVLYRGNWTVAETASLQSTVERLVA
jgi:16S rRNA (guanine527-N7)-methyltransferase